MIRLNLYICTYRRDDLLRRTLLSVSAASARADSIDLAVTVVDDFGAGTTEAMVASLDLPFPVRCVRSAAQNISIARNLGLTSVLPDSDWIGMIDDDSSVPEDWLRVASTWMVRPDVDALTAPSIPQFPLGPKWLQEEPFHLVGLMTGADGEFTQRCSTGNCLMRSEWLREHPDVRFDPDLGVIGGEDIVFFGRAMTHGLRAIHVSAMTLAAIEPASRSTFRYQMRRSLWMGNTEAITNLETGRATRSRLVLRGAKRLAGSVMLEKVRVQQSRPYLSVRRYPLAVALQGVGLVAGAWGVRIAHR